MGQNLFTEINHAVLDLQNSQMQTFERPLRKLAQLLKNSDLAPVNDELTAGVDLEAFLEESGKAATGMMGSAKLAWPDDHKASLGLTLPPSGRIVVTL